MKVRLGCLYIIQKLENWNSILKVSGTHLYAHTIYHFIHSHILVQVTYIG